MKIWVNVSITIEAGIARVYEDLTNLSLHKQWNASLISIEPQTQMREGLSFSTSSRVLGRIFKANNRVTRLIPNQTVELENRTAPLVYVLTYELSEENARTTLSCRMSISSRSNVFKLAVPVLEHVAHDRVETDLKSLKRLVEQDTTKLRSHSA